MASSARNTWLASQPRIPCLSKVIELVSSTTIKNFIETVDASGCRITRLPSRIWVFGGWLSETVSESLKNPASMRDFFLAKALSQPTVKGNEWFSNLDKPEMYPGWHSFSGYDDLHEFERDACYIASSVIIFLESPGALAEAGALTIDDHLPTSLFVVTRDEHYSAESYVRLGPIKRVENLKGEICIINGSPGDRINDDDFETIKDHFGAWNPDFPKTEKFNSDNKTHQLLLISDLVNILLVSKSDDLLKVLSHLGVVINKSKLEKYLSLLHFFDEIKLIKRGMETFYKSHSDFKDCIDYKAVKDKRFSRASFLAARQEEIKQDRRMSYILGGG